MAAATDTNCKEEPSGHEEEEEIVESSTSSNTMSILKSLAAFALLYSAFVTFNNNNETALDMARSVTRRQLSMVGDGIPSYMDSLMADLRARKKLFDETPPEEVKYWFEYTGPLQVRRNMISDQASCEEHLALESQRTLRFFIFFSLRRNISIDSPSLAGRQITLKAGMILG